VTDLPFPDSLDDLNQGANDIKALALELMARGGGYRFQGAQQQRFTADQYGRFQIPFPIPFTGPPVAVFAQSGEVGPFDFHFYAPADANGVLMRCWYKPTNQWAGAGDAYVTWLAVGPA
jgi:hypothetical protein